MQKEGLLMNSIELMDGRLILIPAYDHKEEIRELFGMYTDMLVQGDPKFRKFLEIQRYDDELENPEEKYGMPGGRLYLAYMDGEIAGCIALRKIDDKLCELKRLYVKQEFRGRHIAKQLVKVIIDDAEKIGYDKLLLDTLPFLTTALKMYKELGFYETERYNDSPLDTSIYLALDLKQSNRI